MKEGGIIATSFTIYTDEEKWTGVLEGAEVRYSFSERVLFQLRAMLFSQITEEKSTRKTPHINIIKVR